MNVQKARIVATAVIAASVASVLFIVSQKTDLAVASYIFLLADTAVASAMLWQTAVGKIGKYLANAAMALALKSGLALSVAVCIALPLLEAVGLFAVPVKWFCVIQCFIFAVMGLTALAIGAGADEISRVKNSREVAQTTGRPCGLTLKAWPLPRRRKFAMNLKKCATPCDMQTR